MSSGTSICSASMAICCSCSSMASRSKSSSMLACVVAGGGGGSGGRGGVLVIGSQVCCVPLVLGRGGACFPSRPFWSFLLHPSAFLVGLLRSFSDLCWRPRVDSA